MVCIHHPEDGLYLYPQGPLVIVRCHVGTPLPVLLIRGLANGVPLGLVCADEGHDYFLTTPSVSWQKTPQSTPESSTSTQSHAIIQLDSSL